LATDIRPVSGWAEEKDLLPRIAVPGQLRLGIFNRFSDPFDSGVYLLTPGFDRMNHR
jgi:hypothetical protein